MWLFRKREKSKCKGPKVGRQRTAWLKDREPEEEYLEMGSRGKVGSCRFVPQTYLALRASQ